MHKPNNRIGSAAAALALAALLVTAEASAGLLGYWSGNNTAVDSTGTYNGTLINGAGYAPGLFGGAFSLSGDGSGTPNQSAVLVSPPIPNVSTGLTIAAWINPAQQIVGRQYQIFNNEISYEVAVNGGFLWFAIQSASSGAWAWVNSFVPVALNQWTFFALTYDAASSTVNIFDGSGATPYTGVNVPESNGGSISGNITAGVGSARIGAREIASGGYGFNGLIDEVYLFDMAVDSKTVRSIASNTFFSSVPAPATLALFGLGLLGMAGRRCGKQLRS